LVRLVERSPGAAVKRESGHPLCELESGHPLCEL